MLYTVGHSTRTLEELVEILHQPDIQRLVDVRSVPRSRRHPHFAADALSESLPDHGIMYVHVGALGGFRRPRPDTINGGWEHEAFRGYADYMASPEFQAAAEQLAKWASAEATCVMCAEAQWWRCHRRLIADLFTVRGWGVLHLGLRVQPVEHELTPFAVVGETGTLSYPPAQGSLLA
jgi:uncharacterized protein (DUF488 family)